MIVQMKKISIFLKDIEKVTSLRLLRKLGVMHLTEKSVTSEKVDKLKAEGDDLAKICARIEETYNESIKGSKHIVEERIRVDEVLRKREKILNIMHEENILKQRILEYRAEINRIEKWGDFSPAVIHKLSSQGMKIYLYTVHTAFLDSLPDDVTYVMLSKGKKHSSIAVIGSELEQSAHVIPFQIPEMGLSELESGIQLAEKRLEYISGFFKDEARYLKAYHEVEELILEELRFEMVHHGMEGNGSIAWITGFVPVDHVDELRALAKESSWGLLIEDVSSEDPVPTKLKNNRIVRMIQPVFDILGTVPGYREYDISMFFLLFFSLFFAMIIGDAGYGSLFLLGTVFLHLKSKKLSESVKLLYVLSGTTIAWGAVTGTWFGSEQLLRAIPFLQTLTIPEISSFPEMFNNVTAKDTQLTIMYICFVLGIIQLGIACIINFIRELPDIRAVAQLGWLSLLVGLYYLVLNLVVGMPFPSWGLYLIAVGFALFVLFSEQKEDRSFLKGVLVGLGGLFNTFLDSISAFSNIISYIRLFAVGLASIAIASSFNSMAEPLLGGWTLPAAIVILLLGHGLNLIMGILSVVVHGIRLNMLEFSGQLGMEWTGIKYEPFKEHLESSLEEDSQTNR